MPQDEDMNKNTANEAHPRNPNFIGLQARLAFRNDGVTQWRQLYAPLPGTAAWDGAPEGCVAVESTRPGLEGVFAYVAVEPRAKVATFVACSTGNPTGYRVNVTFDPNTADEETFAAWVVLD